jgi:membrane-associated phospholipid phosphatase
MKADARPGTRSTQETARLGWLGPRLKAHWRFKLMAWAIIVIAFFVGYFLLLGFPIFPVREMPATALDRLIAFQPGALPLYLSLYLYIPLAPWLLDNKRDLNACCLVSSGLCLVGLAIFLCWPTVIPRPDSAAYRPLIAIDGPGNACPSLHAASAVFSAICIDHMARHLGDRGLARGLSWFWCLGILYATLATKQHVAVDLVAGTVLGAAWAGLYLRFFPLAGKFQA